MKKILVALLLWANVFAEPPNVVLVMADDIGLGDLSFYQREAGRTVTVETPNLDQLIKEGMRFSDAHSPASLCAPTRFSMLTGNYSYRNYKPNGVWTPNADSGIDPKFTTIARIAKEGGYQTSFFGKWGLGSSTASKTKGFEKLAKGALHFGFDYALELPQGIQNDPYAFYENSEWMKLAPDSELVEIGPLQNGYHDSKKHNDRSGIGDSNWDPTEAGPILARKASEYIEAHAEDPFFLYYCTQAVHIPHTAPEEFEGVEVKGTTPGRHGDMIKELDLQVGVLINALKKAGVYENTLFVFTSDNGGLSFDRGMKKAGHETSNGLNGSKGAIFEGGHRVPFLAVWPGVIQAGSQSSEPIMGQDMVATVAALAGKDLDREKVKDSMNLLPVFKNEEVRERHEILMHQSMNQGGQYAIRQGPWKLIMSGTREFDAEKLKVIGFYNLDENLAEKESGNLMDDKEHREQVAKMMARYKELRASGAATVN